MKRVAADKVTVTFLEMRGNLCGRVKAPMESLRIDRARSIPLHFYRYLYDVIGQQYLWIDRKRLDDASLAAIIHDNDIELYVLYADGAPVGYAELSFRDYPDVELVHFGLIPEATGRGLGRYFLSKLIADVWSRKPKRLHVQTCTLDHPAALKLYKDCGFMPFAQVVKDMDEFA